LVAKFIRFGILYIYVSSGNPAIGARNAGNTKKTEKEAKNGLGLCEAVLIFLLQKISF
jgi:hypothetical protein